MIYGYIRVSTKMQVQGNSLEEQNTKIMQSYPTAKIVSEAYSGAKGREKFSALLDALQRDDLLVVTKLGRFCRSTKEGLEYIDRLLNSGVKIHILNMGLIEDTPMGRLIVTNLLAFAEFERAMILERTSAGKEIAKQHPDFTEGRPQKYTPVQVSHALALLKDSSYKQVSRLTGISVSTLVRLKNKAEG